MCYTLTQMPVFCISPVGCVASEAVKKMKNTLKVIHIIKSIFIIAALFICVCTMKILYPACCERKLSTQSVWVTKKRCITKYPKLNSVLFNALKIHMIQIKPIQSVPPLAISNLAVLCICNRQTFSM